MTSLFCTQSEIVKQLSAIEFAAWNFRSVILFGAQCSHRLILHCTFEIMTIFCSVGNLAQRPLENQRLGFFLSPYSYYINLFLSCLVIKRTTPHFDSAPVHNGAKQYMESDFSFYILACCDISRYFQKFLACIQNKQVQTILEKLTPI